LKAQVWLKVATE